MTPWQIESIGKNETMCMVKYILLEKGQHVSVKRNQLQNGEGESPLEIQW